MNLEFAQEEITKELNEELTPLIESNFAETDEFPDIERVKNPLVYLNNKQAFRLYTARDNGSPIAYAIYIVQPHPHYENSLQAQQDLIYMYPNYRKGMTGYLFLKWCDEQLKAEGVSIVYQFTGLRRDISAVFTRLGYSKIQSMYARRLN